jgi:hypothetical protein
MRPGGSRRSSKSVGIAPLGPRATAGSPRHGDGKLFSDGTLIFAHKNVIWNDAVVIDRRE